MFPGAVSWDRSLLFAEATVTRRRHRGHLRSRGLSIDLWQRLVGSARSRKSTHYRRDAFYKQAVEGPSATLHKSCRSLLTVSRENDSARLW